MIYFGNKRFKVLLILLLHCTVMISICYLQNFSLKRIRSSVISRAMSSSLKFNSDEDVAIRATRLWVERFVHNYRLCPWVGRVLVDDSLRIIASGFDGESDLSSLVLRESKLLVPGNNSSHTTTLIVLPENVHFTEYLTMTNRLERLLDRKGLHKFVQIATFHPEYIFENADEGSVDGDISNWTNRSPFPIIHLLRVSDVTQAIDSYSQYIRNDDENDCDSATATDKIWKANIKTMQKLGIDKIREVMMGIDKDARLH